MGVYVDAEDIRQHFRQSGALDDDTIEELMAEQEFYVQARLGISALPPNNLILSNIVRDLTIYAGIYTLMAPAAEDAVKADALRAEALRRLDEMTRSGIGIDTNTKTPTGWETEVYNPYGDSPMFSREDFGL